MPECAAVRNSKSVHSVCTAVSAFFLCTRPCQLFSCRAVKAYFPVRPCQLFFLYLGTLPTYCRVTFFSCTTASSSVYLGTYVHPYGRVVLYEKNKKVLQTSGRFLACLPSCLLRYAAVGCSAHLACSLSSSLINSMLSSLPAAAGSTNAAEEPRSEASLKCSTGKIMYTK